MWLTMLIRSCSWLLMLNSIIICFLNVIKNRYRWFLMPTHGCSWHSLAAAHDGTTQPLCCLRDGTMDISSNDAELLFINARGAWRRRWWQATISHTMPHMWLVFYGRTVVSWGENILTYISGGPSCSREMNPGLISGDMWALDSFGCFGFFY